MSHYIDAILIPVPRANLDTYKRMSEEWGRADLRHGALYYSDSIGDDVQPGKITSFPQAVQLKEDEVIALAWVVYRSKEDRDRIGKAVMDDPQLKESMDPSQMPFDCKEEELRAGFRPSSDFRPDSELTVAKIRTGACARQEVWPIVNFRH